MTKTEVNKFRQALEARVITLRKATMRRDAIVIEFTADELESAIGARDREFAMRSLESNSANLRETRAALERIDAGSYGLCLECDEEIGAKRLNAVPWAPLCIRCQEEVDCRCGATKVRPVFALAA